jgi:hypothetical protein
MGVVVSKTFDRTECAVLLLLLLSIRRRNAGEPKNATNKT